MNTDTSITPAATQLALSPETSHALIVNNDLSKLTTEQRVEYYRALCAHAKIDPVGRPFDYLTLNGKVVLYANKNCAEQLRQAHGITIEITRREIMKEQGVFVVIAKASTPTRSDEASGVVPIFMYDKQLNLVSMNPEEIANRMMKAETKAKRRATLSLVGLGIADETEVFDVPQSTPSEVAIVNNQAERLEKSGLPPEGAAPAFQGDQAPVKRRAVKKEAPAATPATAGAPTANESTGGSTTIEATAEIVEDKDPLATYVISTLTAPTYHGKALGDFNDESLKTLYDSWANKPDYIEKFKQPGFEAKAQEAAIIREYAKRRLNLK